MSKAITTRVHLRALTRALLSKPSMIALAAATSFTVGACWNGDASLGLPCENDLQCGNAQLCIGGFCGGFVLCADGLLLESEIACDGVADCVDGIDEDPAICGGDGGSTFECDDATMISETLVCDGNEDCPDGSDEGALCAGRGINQCDASNPDADLSYALGPTSVGVAEPHELLAFDLMGSPQPDAIFSGRDGNSVKVVLDLESSPLEFYFDGPTGAFGGRPVRAVEAGDVNGDMKQDVVIVAGDDQLGAGIYVYESKRPDPPELFGTVVELPDLGLPVDPTVRAVELGRLNNDSSTDIVGVLDAGPIKGAIVVSFGDSTAAAGGGAYFSIEALPSDPLSYDEMFDAELVDINDDGFDDLLVSGISGMTPTLWIVTRDPMGTEVTSWNEPILMPTAGAGLIASGKLRNAPPAGSDLAGPIDIALADLLMSRIVVYENNMGMLAPAGEIMLASQDVKSLVLADINCDGNGDFVYGVGNPPRIEVLFGDGEGGVLASTPLTYEGTGVPHGDIAVGSLDGDSTPDIFTMMRSGNGLAMEQLQVLVTATP